MSDLNFPSVTIEDFKQIVKIQLKEENYRPIFGLGLGGIGKTESIIELAKEENIGYIDIRLLLYNETDLKGIPYPDVNHIKTIWLQNNILPLAERDGNKGILVFDEITSCSRSVRTAAYQLLNERKLGEYNLPDGWIIVCLGNGPEDGGDFNGMEGNFLNRCSVYSVVPSIPTWCDWALKNNINSLVIAYIRFDMNDFHTFNSDDDIRIFASPRSWKAVSDILNANNDIDNKYTQLRIQGNLGTEVGQKFIAFCKLKNNAVSADDIIAGRAGHDFKSKELLFITINSLIKLLTDKIKLERQNGTISDTFIIEMANAINWLLNLNCDGAKEVKMMTFKDITKIDDVLILKLSQNNKFLYYCPGFMSFVNEFARLI